MAARRLALACIFGLLAAPTARAQRPTRAPAPAGPRTIVGVVTDTLGNPLDSADVLVASLKRRTLTGSDGTFRFDDVKPGGYELSARKLGFFPQVRRARVGDAGGTVAFELVRTSYALPPVVTTSTRIGLSGVVGDTAYNIVANAEVSVLATDRRTQTDSTGAFYLDVKPGRHVVRVARAGYAPRMVSVTIPEDSGRRIVVWLTPSDRRSSGRELLLMDSLAERINKMNPVWSKLYTREDIARTGITDIGQLATVGAGKRIDDHCVAVIDGGPRRAPIWSFSPADLEMMEIYTAKPPRPSIAQQTAQIFGRRGPDNRGTAPVEMSTADCGAAIYVWLRK
jgi:hypothetical protein